LFIAEQQPHTTCQRSYAADVEAHLQGALTSSQGATAGKAMMIAFKATLRNSAANFASQTIVDKCETRWFGRTRRCRMMCVPNMFAGTVITRISDPPRRAIKLSSIATCV
jgi:hypothetical protein